MLIRMNSLIRGHSGVRWELLERMQAILDNNITPLVPLRGSISASGGKSYLAPNFRVPDVSLSRLVSALLRRRYYLR